MVLHGRIKNGAVVLAEDVSLPEGTEVTIIISSAGEAGSLAASNGNRVQLPLVPSKQPGTRRIIADRVAELLEDEDVSA